MSIDRRCGTLLFVSISSRAVFVTVFVIFFAVACSSGSTEQATPAAPTAQPAAETPTEVPPPTPEPTILPATPTPDPTATPVPAPTPVPVPAWTEVSNSAAWEARAGLRVLERQGSLYLLGGRTPNQSTIPGDSRIWSDVWQSDDRGASWTEILATGGSHWAPRAYFQAVTHNDALYVVGGQDYGLEPNPFCALFEQGLTPPPGLDIDPDAPCPEFLPTSQFFNDVWRSDDGVAWTAMTDSAPWEPRAGLSAAVLGDHIYVLGGSQNDDSSIIGAGGPARLYFNDVWRSADGATWELMTESAPWEPRAGGAVVAVGDYLYLLGGEDGFTCEPLPDCDPPYFNDVWRSADGAAWELVADAAGWSPRPGHVCKLLSEQIVCFGGFGLLENPLDVWTSADGAEWRELEGTPWNAADSTQAKYDFDAVSVPAAGNEPAAILTFGGDRETFDFADPENYLRIDNDVWQLTLDN